MHRKRQRQFRAEDHNPKRDGVQPRGWTLAQRFHNVTKQAEFWFLLLVPIALLAVVLFLGVGAGQADDVIKVNLEQTSEVSPVQQISAPGDSSGNALRAAIAGVLSPTKTLEYYQELLAYMGQNMGQEVALFLKPTYAEINDLVRGQRVDIAFVCSLAYVEGKQDLSMELLVVPQMYGETVYYSYLIVPQDSTSQSLEDIRGGSFAFTDPLSNSGHLAPSYQISLLGEDPVSFFDRYIYTYSHDNSIVAVADKLVDGAAIDSLIYDQLVLNNPELTSRTKVISRWGPYGIPPVVINPAMEPQVKQQLRDFFLNLHNSDEGKAILNNLAIDKFIVVPDDAYDSIRDMKTKLGW